MKPGRRYATPVAFKQALEDRLKSVSTSGADVARRRQLIVFERFLARVAEVASEAVILKGGLVLEAEKLHALTMPRSRPNSRVRDLPDIALLATTGKIESRLLREAIKKTFDFRATHPIPKILPELPGSWKRPYAAMATADELPWLTLPAVTRAVGSFANPVLGSPEPVLTWDPDTWSWRRPIGG